MILPTARRDLIEIGDFIALDDAARARDFVAAIEAVIVEQIAERPGSFPLRDQLMAGLRAARHRRYLIFFMDKPEQIEIVRVLHGSRDLPTTFDT